MRGFLVRAVWGLWFGGGLFLAAVAAPTAFRKAGNSVAAANVVGGMLDWWHWLAIGSPVLLLLLARQSRGNWRVLAPLVVALVLASAQFAVDHEVAGIRASSATPISDLSRDDPVRRRFGMLHGVSSSLLLAQILAAAATNPSLGRGRNNH